MGAGIDFPRQDLFGTRNRDRRNLGSQFIAGPVDLLVDIGLARPDDAVPPLLGPAHRGRGRSSNPRTAGLTLVHL